MYTHLTAFLLFLFLPSLAVAEKAFLDESNAAIPAERRDDTILLDAAAAAEAFGWKTRTEASEKLLVLCRDKDSGACIPLRLNEINSTEIDGKLFVEASALGKALGFVAEDRDGKISLRRVKFASADVDERARSAVPAYHSAWEKGRGFRAGQTLPDIPLYSMDGREVRFSQFLGKQYVIYVWASW